MGNPYKVDALDSGGSWTIGVTMHGIIVSFVASLALVAAVPTKPQRIVGGSITAISQHPFTAALLYSRGAGTFTQWCGGTIVTTGAVVTAAHCVYGDSTNYWRVRVGSSYGNSGGSVYNTRSLLVHPQYNTRDSSFDFAIMKITSNFVFGNNVRSIGIAGINYNLGDNQPVTALGWGAVTAGGAGSEQLRQVQIWTVNQAICRQRYAELGLAVTESMLCSGWLDVGGRDQCQGDSGGPLIHENVLVGVCSWGYSCAQPRYPGVNARVSSATNWIVNNAN